MGYSKNQKPAKDFLRWIHSKPVFDEWFTSQQGYTDGATNDVGEGHGVGRRSGAAAVPATCRAAAGCRAMPGRPTARPPRW